MKPLLLAAILVVAPSSVAVAASPPSAHALLRDIENRGAKKVLWELWDDDARLSAVLDHVESGGREWLEVARLLRQASDAGAALSLNYAVAFALLKQPEHVLGLVGRGFDIDDICTSPIIEPKKGEAELYERRALKALRRLEKSPLARLAGNCANRIRLR
jgi:hypothetical protein